MRDQEADAEAVEGEVLDADAAGVEPGADDATGGDEPDGPVVDERSEGGGDAVTALQAEVASLKDKLARARADYHNLQKRVERDAAVERDRAKARAVEDFLQVYEYGKMAEFEAERNPGPLAEGVKMIVREFDRMLEREGVASLGKVGEPFDAGLHEAHATEAVDGVAPGHVSRVIARGYKLGDRVLRFAKVAVAPEPDGEDE